MNNIQEHKKYVTSQIEKAFGVEIEKAHNVGDEKEFNGKTYVWTEYAPGKFDWHVKKEGKKTDEDKQPKQNTESDEPMVGGKPLSEHAAAASTEALKKVVESPNVNKELKSAAKKELDKRNEGGDGGKKDDDKTGSISVESIESCNVNTDDKDKNLFAQSIKQSPYHFKYGNGPDQEIINVRIRANKKDALKEIESINQRLGTNLSIDDFEHTRRYSDNTYDIHYNPQTGTWGNSRKISDELNSAWYEQNSESEKKTKPQKMKPSLLNKVVDAMSENSRFADEMESLIRKHLGDELMEKYDSDDFADIYEKVGDENYDKTVTDLISKLPVDGVKKLYNKYIGK